MKPGARIAWAAVFVLGLAGGAQAQGQSPRDLLRTFQQAFIELSAQVRPSVVEISSEGPISDEEREQMNELFRFFDQQQQEEGGEGTPEGNPHQLPDRSPRATASGFIVDALGHIVTNNHVVRGADKIEVQLWDGTVVPAEITGTDPDADLAVIKINPEGLDLRPVQLAADDVQVGQFAIAMGSPNGLTGSFSYGHVTGLGRESLELPDRDLRFQNFIQTDAAINLGNSGGPLCDIDGHVIGVNVAIVYRANSIGFAIPVSRVREVVPQLIASGKVVRGWLGVGVDEVANVAMSEEVTLDEFIQANKLPDKYGSYISSVTAGGPAEKGKIEVDDVIREINGERIENSTDLINTISALAPGDTAKIKLWRRGEEVELNIPVAPFPGQMAARYGRDYLGMHVRTLELNPEFMQERGMKEAPSDFFVVDLVPKGPAAEAGIRRGDVVVEVGYKEVKNLEQFRKALKQEAKPGVALLMKVWTLTEDEPRKVYVKVPAEFTLD
jgi:serine protease Do